MTKAEFLRILDEDDFLNYLKLIQHEFRKDLRLDTDCVYHKGQYDTATAIMDKYIYLLEKKYKIGRGINGNN